MLEENKKYKLTDDVKANELKDGDLEQVSSGYDYICKNVQGPCNYSNKMADPKCNGCPKQSYF